MLGTPMTLDATATTIPSPISSNIPEAPKLMGSLTRKHTQPPPTHRRNARVPHRSLVLHSDTAHEITAMKRRAGHNMLTISHLALALPRATAFTAFRRRFQPRVVLRGMGTEQLGAVAAPGVRVSAPWKDGLGARRGRAAS
mgnify:CR=1 FL=1